MTRTYEAIIEPYDESLNVTFERPGVITRMRLIRQMPDNLSEVAEQVEEPGDVDDVGLDQLEMADIEWMHEVLRECTDLPDDVVDSLPVETFLNMVEPAAQMIADDPPNEVTIDQPKNSEYKVKEVKEKL